MQRSATTLCALIIATALTGVACGQAPGEPPEAESEVRTHEAALAAPEVRIDNAVAQAEEFDESLPGTARVEVWLIPDDREAGATDEPVRIADRAMEGSIDSTGVDPGLEPGMYDLAVRLVIAEGEDEAGQGGAAMLVVEDDGAVHSDEEGDGNPLPLPADLVADEDDEDSESEDSSWQMNTLSAPAIVDWRFDGWNIDSRDSSVDIDIDARVVAELRRVVLEQREEAEDSEDASELAELPDELDSDHREALREAITVELLEE